MAQQAGDRGREARHGRVFDVEAPKPGQEGTLVAGGFRCLVRGGQHEVRYAGSRIPQDRDGVEKVVEPFIGLRPSQAQQEVSGRDYFPRHRAAESGPFGMCQAVGHRHQARARYAVFPRQMASHEPGNSADPGSVRQSGVERSAFPCDAKAVVGRMDDRARPGNEDRSRPHVRWEQGGQAEERDVEGDEQQRPGGRQDLAPQPVGCVPGQAAEVRHAAPAVETAGAVVHRDDACVDSRSEPPGAVVPARVVLVARG